MTPVNFTYWLQGFFEISDSNTLSTEQVKMIRAHLNLVFFHAIDPETLKDKTEVEKLKYKKIHDGAKSGDSISAQEFAELIKKSTLSVPSISKDQDYPKAYFHDNSRIVYNC